MTYFKFLFQGQSRSHEIRFRLIHLTLSAIQVAETINWRELTHALSGLSAAVVVKAAQNAAKAAVLSGRKCVTQNHLKDAIADLIRDGVQPHGS